MTCCEIIQQNFVNESITTVPYADELGEHPLIEVVYYDGTNWVQQGIFTQIRKESGQIVVDHGGLATGVIKIS